MNGHRPTNLNPTCLPPRMRASPRPFLAANDAPRRGILQEAVPSSRSPIVVEAKFAIGQLIHHKLFDYRGVIVEIDAEFSGTDEWYDSVARTRPPKDGRWYHVLVDNTAERTYVAERNLEPDSSDMPIEHPLLGSYFDGFIDGRYVRATTLN